MVSVRCRKCQTGLVVLSRAALTLACADEEGDEEEGGDGEEDGSEDLCMDDQTDEAAQLEAAQLLQEFRSFGQVAGAGCAAPGAVAAAAAVPAAGATGAGADPLAKRKRGRPLGSKSRAEAAADWEPKEVSVTITGGARDIEPSKLDDMEAFLSEYCLAGIDI